MTKMTKEKGYVQCAVCVCVCVCVCVRVVRIYVVLI